MNNQKVATRTNKFLFYTKLGTGIRLFFKSYKNQIKISLLICGP